MIGARLGPWLLDSEIGRGGMAAVYLAHADPPPADAPAVAAVKVLAPNSPPNTASSFASSARSTSSAGSTTPTSSASSTPASTTAGPGSPWGTSPAPVSTPCSKRAAGCPGARCWRSPVRSPRPSSTPTTAASSTATSSRRTCSGRPPPPPTRGGKGGDGPGVVKLGDFGVASLFASRHLTVTGGVVGTAEFLSPEQAAGKPVTARSDLYSFGVVLYTLLTGRPPFEGEVIDLLHKHRFARFDPPLRFVPEMPDDFNDVICELMEKDPDKRPADGGVLFRRLDGVRRRADRPGVRADDRAAAPSRRGSPPARRKRSWAPGRRR